MHCRVCTVCIRFFLFVLQLLPQSDTFSKEFQRIRKTFLVIRKAKRQIGIYVITLASNTQNLLDIIPSYELMQKGYPKKDMVVVGLAKGYDEAIEVAASIVDEVYHSTGTFAVRAYLAEKQG